MDSGNQPSSLSDQLRIEADALWHAQLDHPFIRGISDGTLDPERFGFWLRQDYCYLIEYSRVLAYAAGRSPDLETMTVFATLLNETLGTEMDLHRSFVADFGITATDLESEVLHPVTRAYTDFLIRTAAIGDFAELVAALIPCMWGYSDLGRAMAARPLPQDPRYVRWIEMYSSQEFADLAIWCRHTLDRVGQALSPASMERVRSAFITSCEYELAFWQMAWDVSLE